MSRKCKVQQNEDAAMELVHVKEEMDIEKADPDAEAASSTSNNESDEDADGDGDAEVETYADVDMEESPRRRKSVSSIIAEMAIKTKQEAVSSSSKAKMQKEDKQKRLGEVNSAPLLQHNPLYPIPYHLLQNLVDCRPPHWPLTYANWRRSSTSLASARHVNCRAANTCASLAQISDVPASRPRAWQPMTCKSA